MALSKDIRLEGDGALFNFKFLTWDSEFFGKNSYFLDVTSSKLAPSEKIKDLISQKLNNTFTAAKIDTGSDKKLLAFLQMSGFNYIDTEITLMHNEKFAKENISVDGAEVYEIKKNENIPYEKLGSTFIYSRFHSDMNIPKEKADLVWVNYIRNYKPSEINKMFIVKYNGEVAGSILVGLTEEKKSADLFFVSVLKKFQGKKIGSVLIRYVVEKLSKKEITVKTQVKNISSLNFYIKNGFSVIKQSEIIFHRWS